MTDRLIRVLENGRIATRGLNRQDSGVALSVDEDETLPISVDWSSFLGSDTIDSVTNNATGATISGASNTTTTTTFKVTSSSSGIIEHRITTAAGTVKELPIFINGTSRFYGGCKWYD